jgi:hypothetical protein
MTLGTILLPVFITISLTAISLLLTITVKKTAALLAAFAAVAVGWFSYWAFLYPTLNGSNPTQIFATGLEYNNFLYLGASILILTVSANMARSLRKPQENMPKPKKPAESVPANPAKPSGGATVTATAGILRDGAFVIQLDHASLKSITESIVKQIVDENLLVKPKTKQYLSSLARFQPDEDENEGEVVEVAEEVAVAEEVQVVEETVGGDYGDEPPLVEHE